MDAKVTWNDLTGDSDIPAWDALSEDQREQLEALGYGPLSYSHYVEAYKKWYGQPNATWNLYRFLERQQDAHWGGHGSEHIEAEFEQRHEIAALRAQLSSAQAERDRFRAALEQCGNEAKWERLRGGLLWKLVGEKIEKIAAEALDETVTPKDVPNRGGDEYQE